MAMKKSLLGCVFVSLTLGLGGCGHSGVDQQDALSDPYAAAAVDDRPFVWPEGFKAALSLTFDDARVSQIEVGIPILNAYEVRGSGYFDMERTPHAGDRTVVLFDDGEEVMVCTEAQGVRFLLIAGRPLGEPVAWYGPIVMNTREELRVAFEEYRRGTFIKYGG